MLKVGCARTSALMVSVGAAVLVSPAAHADTSPNFWSGVDCDGPACEVTATVPGQIPAVSGTPQGEGGDVSGQGGPACVTADVEFAQSGLEGPLEMPLGMAECVATASGDAGVPEFDPVALAEQARAAMRVPEPVIGTAPPLDKPRFVNLPSWMWVDADDWEAVSVTASVSAGSVTVVAVPERVVWDTGDGHEVVCTVPGTVFSPDVYREEGSPDCGHTYTTLPPGGAGATVGLAAVWEWRVSWSTTDGRGGELDALTTEAGVSVPVSEIHAVVTDIR